MSALTVGLTGGLASGKSTLGRWLAEAGFEVADADEIVGDLYRSGEPGSRAVAHLFGREMLDAEGGVDRARLAERVFTDDEARARLESVVHPLVRRRFQELAATAGGVMVLEVPLLVEADMAGDFDLVVTVEADERKRLERAVARGLEAGEARARLAAQAPETERRAAADIVVENDGDLAAFRRRAEDLIGEIRRRAATDGLRRDEDG